jgi:hypothetical protein
MKETEPKVATDSSRLCERVVFGPGASRPLWSGGWSVAVPEPAAAQAPGGIIQGIAYALY